MARVKNSVDSAGHSAQQAAVTASAVPVMVAAARHSRRASRTSTAIAGVSLKAAASPLSAPRRRERPGTASRSSATRAMRTALTCPYSMVLGTGSSAVTAARASQGAAPAATSFAAPRRRSSAHRVAATHRGVAATSSTWAVRSDPQVRGVSASAAKGG